MSTVSSHDKAVLNSIFNPTLPLGEAIYDESLSQDLKDDDNGQETPELKQIEANGILAAESGKFAEAIDFFNAAIALAPQRSAGYNNRAQVYRLAGKDNDAFNDLMKSIEISGNAGRSYCQALCQRGLLFRKEGREDEARADFELAAKLGSQFAKAQLVEMNPYAAMCNQMLQKVIYDLRQFEQD